MAFRRTKGIVTDSDLSDPKKEADVIMTAAALGFAAWIGTAAIDQNCDFGGPMLYESVVEPPAGPE